MALTYSIKYYPSQTKLRNKPYSLKCFVYYNNMKMAFTTDVKVEVRYWSSDKQRADENSKFDGTSINNRLNEISQFIHSKFSLFQEYPDPVFLKSICQKFLIEGEVINLESKPNEPIHGLISYLNKIIEDSFSGNRLISKGPRKGQKYHLKSIQSYQSTVKILKEFAKYKLVGDFKFNQVNDDFYKDLSKFFYSNLKLSTGYFSGIIKYIKLTMNEAYENGLHSVNTHNSRSFIKPIYESDTIYLNTEQINILQAYQFDEKEGLYENARDLFLVGCWTGLRFSDFSTLSSKDITDNIIRIKTQKTSARVAIPLHPMLKKLIDKYDGGFPRAISNQKLNNYIKIAARKAGLTEKVIVRKNVAGIDVEETKELCDLITTHTARRSFATNMFKKGIPTLLIMAITGHKTEAAFLKYIRVSNEEKAQMMAEHWKKIDWD